MIQINMESGVIALNRDQKRTTKIYRTARAASKDLQVPGAFTRKLSVAWQLLWIKNEPMISAYTFTMFML
jgi:hypothetical protein